MATAATAVAAPDRSSSAARGDGIANDGAHAFSKNYHAGLSPEIDDMLHFLSDMSAEGHQALALFLIAAYGAVTAVSMGAHSQRHKYHNMQLRAVSLLREAARSSQRAKKGGDPGDVYADSARARIFVSAVDRLLSSEEVAKLTGVSLDEFRAHVDNQLADARTALYRASSSGGNGLLAAPLVGGGSHIGEYSDLGSQPVAAFTRGATVRMKKG